MADISKIVLPNGGEYNLKDSSAIPTDSVDITGQNVKIVDLVKDLGVKHIDYRRWICKTDGGSANIPDKPAGTSYNGFVVEAVCNRWASSGDYRYALTAWSSNNYTPFTAIVTQNVTLITWKKLVSTDGTIAKANKIVDANDSNDITIAYSKAGLESSNWLAAWNGYELRAMSPSKLTAGKATADGDGKVIKENYAFNRYLTNEDLNGLTVPGFYNAGGGNTVTNKPSDVDAFGLIVVHNAAGSLYSQILYRHANGSKYTRYNNGSTWSPWVGPTFDTNSPNWFGECSTGASTQEKVVTCTGFVLTYGAKITVHFANSQSYNGTPTLNVNGTGAKNIQHVSSTNTGRYEWVGGAYEDFVYNGTCWVMVGHGHATTTYYGVTKLGDSVASRATGQAATIRSVSTLTNALFQQSIDTGINDYSTSTVYSVGTYVYYDGQIYICNTDGTTGTWDASKWDKVIPLQEQIDQKADNFGIIDHPIDTFGADNETGHLYCYAKGKDISYQWWLRVSGSNNYWSKATNTGYNTHHLSAENVAGRRNYIYKCVVTDKSKTFNPIVERGGINGSTGQEIYVDTRIRTISYDVDKYWFELVPSNSSIKPAISISYFDASGNLIEGLYWYNTNSAVPINQKGEAKTFRIVVRYNDNADAVISDADMAELRKSLVFHRIDTSKEVQFKWNNSVRLGFDANGNPGFYKAGADTVTPFKSGDNSNAEELTYTTSGDTVSVTIPNNCTLLMVKTEYHWWGINPNQSGWPAITYSNFIGSSYVSDSLLDRRNEVFWTNEYSIGSFELHRIKLNGSAGNLSFNLASSGRINLKIYAIIGAPKYSLLTTESLLPLGVVQDTKIKLYVSGNRACYITSNAGKPILAFGYTNGTYSGGCAISLSPATTTSAVSGANYFAVNLSNTKVSPGGTTYYYGYGENNYINSITVSGENTGKQVSANYLSGIITNFMDFLVDNYLALV